MAGSSRNPRSAGPSGLDLAATVTVSLPGSSTRKGRPFGHWRRRGTTHRKKGLEAGCGEDDVANAIEGGHGIGWS